MKRKECRVSCYLCGGVVYYSKDGKMYSWGEPKLNLDHAESVCYGKRSFKYLLTGGRRGVSVFRSLYVVAFGKKFLILSNNKRG